MKDTQVITGSFQGFDEERLLKAGITNQKFKVIENVNEDVFNSLRVGDKINFIFNGQTYIGTVQYKYRDAKDIKVELDE